MGSCRIRLLFSLSAALPFSEEGHPVFNWRASVSCGHFLGVLFRYISEGQGVEPLQAVAGAITGHDTTEGEDDDIEAPTGEERENSETNYDSEIVPSQSSLESRQEGSSVSSSGPMLGARKKGFFCIELNIISNYDPFFFQTMKLEK